MTPQESIEVRRERHRQRVRELVEELGSYSSAARQLGITRQAIHSLIGPGVVDGRAVVMACTDCGREMTTQATTSEPRCERCRTFFKRTGQPWTQEQSGRHKQRSHCRHGHVLDGDNVYVTPDGRRQCRTCIRLRWQKQNEKRRDRTTKGNAQPDDAY